MKIIKIEDLEIKILEDNELRNANYKYNEIKRDIYRDLKDFQIEYANKTLNGLNFFNFGENFISQIKEASGERLPVLERKIFEYRNALGVISSSLIDNFEIPYQRSRLSLNLADRFGEGLKKFLMFARPDIKKKLIKGENVEDIDGLLKHSMQYYDDAQEYVQKAIDLFTLLTENESNYNLKSYRGLMYIKKLSIISGKLDLGKSIEENQDDLNKVSEYMESFKKDPEIQNSEKKFFEKTKLSNTKHGNYWYKSYNLVNDYYSLFENCIFQNEVDVYNSIYNLAAAFNQIVYKFDYAQKGVIYLEHCIDYFGDNAPMGMLYNKYMDILTDIARKNNSK
jgi:hypothetical protein